MKRQITLTILALITTINFSFTKLAPKRDFYQIKVYHLQSDKQVETLDNYLKNAYIPALHRQGIKHVGVFKPVKTEDNADKLVYVFIPFQSSKEFFQLDAKLDQDQAYLKAGSDYIDAAHDNVPFTRIETILINAFEDSPNYKTPNLTSSSKDRIYELRSYEGPTEKLYKNKVKMFNDGDEIGLFKRLDFNAIFYGEVIAGSRMPNLMYMTSFENMEARDAHWKTFGGDAYWKELSSKAEYQNNVSKADIILLHQTDYSDL
ncbi:MAG: NIPSNAP family containing protein [Thalassobius sp.]|nr:NIPSNAP family containing protein [Thalassovita sp.]